jgi:mannosidase alpha-like ER degradation enhancer 2
MRKYGAVLLVMTCLVSAAQTGKPFPDKERKAMREKVIDACRHAWQGYKDYAWGFDELQPLTKKGKNWYKHSLLMTPVDAFDTFILLGMKKEAEEAKQLILSQLNFDIDDRVQLFEITIRLLGGLQSAYELDGDKRFLALAEDLANRLLPAFRTPTGMPCINVHLQTGALKDSINNPAEIGTLMLEFGHLSKLTGNAKYYNTAKKAIMEVYRHRSAIGLMGLQIDVSTGEWKNKESCIGAYIDSYYEYLFKAWKLFGDKDFKAAWDTHQKAISAHLISKQPNGWFLTHVNMDTGKEINPAYGALDAFYAGLCAYSGDVATAKEVQKANWYMWTTFNMEPEEFNFKTNSVLSPYYILRPENLESCFYLYRYTKDDQYLWMGKRIVDDIITHCRYETGFSSLKNVSTFERANSMQSFFFAETLKYAYLLFAPEQAIDLKKIVFNTEAHPLQIKK